MCRLLEEMRKEVAVEAEAKGKAEGRMENARTTALKMLSKGCYSLEEISELTDLSLEEIQKLAKCEN